MTKTVKKWSFWVAVACPLFFLGNVFAFDLEKPTANLTEKWTTNSAGWNVSGALSGWTNGAMKVGFPVDTSETGSGFLLSGNTNASSGAFAGDYQSKAIDAVSFMAKAVDLTITPVFYFKTSSGTRTWRTKLTSGLGSDWKTNVVPFTYTTNWWTSMGNNNESCFVSDKANIGEVGFELTRGTEPATTNAQEFVVDNLKLVGPWGGPYVTNGTTVGVSLAWVLENGLTNDLSTINTDDNDGDHFNNLAEYLAGTDPNDSSSYFRIEIVRNESGQMVVRWLGNKYVTFDLLEASSLSDPAPFTPKMTNITAITSQEVVVGDDGARSKFYKVEIKANK